MLMYVDVNSVKLYNYVSVYVSVCECARHVWYTSGRVLLLPMFFFFRIWFRELYHSGGGLSSHSSNQQYAVWTLRVDSAAGQ